MMTPLQIFQQANGGISGWESRAQRGEASPLQSLNTASRLVVRMKQAGIESAMLSPHLARNRPHLARTRPWWCCFLERRVNQHPSTD